MAGWASGGAAAVLRLRWLVRRDERALGGEGGAGLLIRMCHLNVRGRRVGMRDIARVVVEMG